MLFDVSEIEILRSKIAQSYGTKKVVINGCFDLFHAGHLNLIRKAKEIQEGPLIVGLNSDESIRRIKGNSRPIIADRERLEIVSAIRYVDFAFIFEGDSFAPFLDAVGKCTYIKGPDYLGPSLEEQKALDKYGSCFLRIGGDRTVSTSNIIKLIQGKQGTKK